MKIEIRYMMKLIILTTLITMAGCASEILRHPAELLSVNQRMGTRYVTPKSISLTLDTAYKRTINAGTEFIEIGTIQQGSVLKPTNATFTIEGAHMHEAYPVLSNGRVVGFYLPVEKAFSPLSQSVDFPIQARSP